MIASRPAWKRPARLVARDILPFIYSLAVGLPGVLAIFFPDTFAGHGLVLMTTAGFGLGGFASTFVYLRHPWEDPTHAMHFATKRRPY